MRKKAGLTEDSYVIGYDSIKHSNEEVIHWQFKQVAMFNIVTDTEPDLEAAVALDLETSIIYIGNTGANLKYAPKACFLVYNVG